MTVERPVLRKESGHRPDKVVRRSSSHVIAQVDRFPILLCDERCKVAYVRLRFRRGGECQPVNPSSFQVYPRCGCEVAHCALTPKLSGAEVAPTGRSNAGPRPIERRVRLQHSTNLAKALGHTGLPTRTGSLPFLNDVRGKPNRDQFAGIGRAGPASLLYHRMRQGLFRKFGQILVLVRTDRMRIDASEIRFQSTARGGLSHDRYPFAC